jgi:hypothetical protein
MKFSLNFRKKIKKSCQGGVLIEGTILILDFLQISVPQNKTPVRFRSGNTVVTGDKIWSHQEPPQLSNPEEGDQNLSPFVNEREIFSQE